VVHDSGWSGEAPDERETTGALPLPVRLALCGAAGSVTVTLLNETARRVAPHTPRMDVVGERGLAKVLRAAEQRPPRGAALYRWSMAGDLASNGAFYALAGIGPRRQAWIRGLLLGATMGIGAVLLPRPLGLGSQPGSRTPLTQALTVAWYTAGGLAAAAVGRALGARGDGSTDGDGR